MKKQLFEMYAWFTHIDSILLNDDHALDVATAQYTLNDGTIVSLRLSNNRPSFINSNSIRIFKEIKGQRAHGIVIGNRYPSILGGHLVYYLGSIAATYNGKYKYPILAGSTTHSIYKFNIVDVIKRGIVV